jgi:anti-anti-sigma regulatory factor
MTTNSDDPEPVGSHFVEAVDQYSATIRARGHLTEQGADLIRGAVEVLHRSGHHRITVDLHDVRAVDDEALVELRSLAVRLRAHHGELVVLSEERKERQ